MLLCVRAAASASDTAPGSRTQVQAKAGAIFSASSGLFAMCVVKASMCACTAHATILRHCYLAALSWRMKSYFDLFCGMVLSFVEYVQS
jgi:hypothetical protein